MLANMLAALQMVALSTAQHGSIPQLQSWKYVGPNPPGGINTRPAAHTSLALDARGNVLLAYVGADLADQKPYVRPVLWVQRRQWKQLVWLGQ